MYRSAARVARAARHGAHNAKRALRAKAARAREAVAKAGVSTTPSAARNDATPAVYGDAAYASGEFLDHLANNGIASFCKTQPPHAPAGRFAKGDFIIDLKADTVTCPTRSRSTATGTETASPPSGRPVRAAPSKNAAPTR
jgi:hypothetical protein